MSKPSESMGFGLLLLGSAFATILALIWQRQTVCATGWSLIGYAMAIAGCAVLHVGHRRPVTERRRMLRDLAEYYGFFMALCLIGVVASYPAAAASAGTVDPLLARADRLLHFDWVRLYRFVTLHPALQAIGSAAYRSIPVTPAILLAWFAMEGRRDDAYRFLIAFWLAAAVTLILFRWLPAAGPLAYLWHGPIDYMPQSALYQAQLIPALRHHAEPIDLGMLHGLVSAPSFHAASATLYILAARQSKRLGPPLIALNVAMLLATPVEGTHYLVDVLSGIVVALAAYGAAGALRAPRRAARASARFRTGLAARSTA